VAGPNIPVTKGISAQAVRSIPNDWDAQWFKRFITDHMQKADYRNATAGNGITITGTEQGGGTISSGGTLTSPVVIPAPATSSAALTVQGSTISSGIQVIGYVSTGFTGQGVELGFTGGTGYLQAYDRTNSVSLPLTLTATTMTFSPGGGVARLTLGATASVQSAYNFAGSAVATSATAGGSSALPATPLGYWQIEINGVNVKIPYYNN